MARIISLLFFFAFCSVCQAQDSTTVGKDQPIIDGKTSSQLVGKFLKTKKRVISFIGHPNSKNQATLLKNTGFGPVLSVLKYQGQIFVMWGKQNPVSFVKATDKNLKVVVNPPEVTF